jgi:poly(A) polymerase
MSPTDARPLPLPSLAGAAWLVRPSAVAVFDALARAGFPARAVGGSVRNALLDRPVADVDIATPATPGDVIAACTAAGLTCIPTGIEHGTITVLADGDTYEVTTLRRDVSTDGRRATVAFTDDWTLDAQRRDFTMNALTCDADGTVFDPLGGYTDLLARRVRFIGDADARIAEDYLRILRFFRFHAELGIGDADPAALAACARGRQGLAQLSAERVRAEMVRLLAAGRAIDAIAAMADSGVLPSVLGAAPRLDLFAAIVRAEGNAGYPPDPILRLSALAIAVEEDAERIARRWRLSRAESGSLFVIDSRLASIFDGLDPPSARRLLYRLGPTRWRQSCLALVTVATTSTERAAAATHLDLPARWLAPTFPLRGADILAAGVSPGPRVGALLARLEDWWIAADFPPEPDVRAKLAELLSATIQPP